MKKITIFGSTGSIGRQTLALAEEFPDRVHIVGLSAGKNIQVLSQQIKKWNPQIVVVAEEKDARALQRQFPNLEFDFGEQGLLRLAAIPVDTIVMALMGFVGLAPIIEALRHGQRLALANKEPIVAAGELFDALSQQYGGSIFPVDSEHSAIFQALHGSIQDVEKVILTASGGPFYRRPESDLIAVTPEEAVRHPKWQMGKKLSVDSATLMNKGLELIEARWLFQLKPEQLAVVIHPQSLVHGMVQYRDGSLMAHLGYPDMRMPIAYALSYPERWPLTLPRLSWQELSTLRFEEPEYERFPALKAAMEVNQKGGLLPTIMSAANEAAVEAFLAKRIRFTKIVPVVLEVLEHNSSSTEVCLESILESDCQARDQAEKIIRKIQEMGC